MKGRPPEKRRKSKLSIAFRAAKQMSLREVGLRWLLSVTRFGFEPGKNKGDLYARG